MRFLTDRSAAFALAVSSALVSVAACAPSEVADEGESAAAQSTFGDDLDVDLPVLDDESPSGSLDFTFCAHPRKEASLHLGNAAWLAMFSANEYAHLRHLAPQLYDLGFGERRVDYFWVDAAKDMSTLRAFEGSHVTELEAARRRGPDALVTYMRRNVEPDFAGFPIELTGVGRSYFRGVYTGRDGDGELVMPARALRDWLVRSSDPTNEIQFFSARATSFFERQLGKGSTQAFVAKHEGKKVVVVAFRGTEVPTADAQVSAIVDILRDLTFWRTNADGYGFSPGWGKTHKGFMEALESADEGDRGQVLTEKVRGLVGDDPDVGVWVTGHSLGGALATLFTARLLDMQETRGVRFNVRGMYTFGAPRVGDATFRKKMEELAAKHGVELVRFRNDSDVVTSVPFDILGYEHVGARVLVRDGAMQLLDEDPARGRSAADHAVSGILAVGGRREATNGYYARIRKLLHANTDPALVACDDP